MGTGLVRVDVFEGERILAHLGRIWRPADPVVIILEKVVRSTKIVICISAPGKIPVDVTPRLTQQGQRIKIGPALSHPLRLLTRKSAEAATDSAKAQAMG